MHTASSLVPADSGATYGGMRDEQVPEPKKAVTVPEKVKIPRTCSYGSWRQLFLKEVGSATLKWSCVTLGTWRPLFGPFLLIKEPH